MGMGINIMNLNGSGLGLGLVFMGFGWVGLGIWAPMIVSAVDVNTLVPNDPNPYRNFNDVSNFRVLHFVITVAIAMTMLIFASYAYLFLDFV